MERFFIKSFKVNELTEELLLRRYSNIDYILNKNYDDGFELMKIAHEKDIEDKLWQQWLTKYPYMTEEDFVSFEEFKNYFIKDEEETKVENLNKEQIFDKVEDIINLTLKEGGEVDGDRNI